MRQIALISLLIIISSAANAQEDWQWKKVGFLNSDELVIIERTGTAAVQIDGKHITINLKDSFLRELKPTFKGTINNGLIKGIVKNFELEVGDYLLQGNLRSQGASCQIILDGLTASSTIWVFWSDKCNQGKVDGQ
jgi:hypothetical protein